MIFRYCISAVGNYLKQNASIPYAYIPYILDTLSQNPTSSLFNNVVQVVLNSYHDSNIQKIEHNTDNITISVIIANTQTNNTLTMSTINTVTGISQQSSAYIPTQVISDIISNIKTTPFVVFQRLKWSTFNNLFKNKSIVVSDIYGLEILDSTGHEIVVSNSTAPIVIHIPLIVLSTYDNLVPLCSYWSDQNANWIPDCITQLDADGLGVTCSCHHLTNFTVGMYPKTNTDDNPSLVDPNNPNTFKWLPVIIAASVGFLVIIMIVIVIILILKSRRKTRRLKKAVSFEFFTINGEVKESSIDVKKEIGRGGYSVVYEAMMNNTTQVAVKQFKKDAGGILEASLLQRLHHPHIIQYMGVYRTRQNVLSLVTEYVAGGTILDRVRSQKFDIPSLWSM